MKNTTKGFTLTELIIAVAVLAVIVGPLIGLFIHAEYVNAQTIRLQTAQVTAQLRLEELVGRTWDGANGVHPRLVALSGGSQPLVSDGSHTDEQGNTFPVEISSYNLTSDIFPVTVTVTRPYDITGRLILAVITVSDGEKELYRLENVLNVTPGG